MRFCHNLIDFPTYGRNIFFTPSIFAHNKGTFVSWVFRQVNQNSILKRASEGFVQTFSSQNVGSYSGVSSFINDYPLVLDKFTQRISESLSLYSLSHRSVQFMFISAIHRGLQITSNSLQHKIEITSFDGFDKVYPGLGTAAKATTKFAASAIPFIGMYYLGYAAIELLLASAVRTASSYLFSTSLSNKIKSIDLVSPLKEFSFSKILENNIFSFFRNLATTALIDINGFLFGVKSGTRDKASIVACVVSDEEIILYGKSVDNLKFNIFNILLTELGWSFGRLFVDTGLGLAKKFNLISDLRDPFFRFIFKAPNATVPESEVEIVESSASNSAPVKEQNAKSSVLNDSYRSPEIFKQEKTGKIVKGPRKRIQAEALENKPSEPNTKKTEENLKPNTIFIPDYPDQPLVPLKETYSNSWVYGMVANRRATHFNEFSQTLNNADCIRPKGKIQCIDAKGKMYEIRPSSSDARLLGVKVDTDASAESLNNVYGYERGIFASEQLRSQGFNSSVIPFSKETDHSNLNKDKAKLAQQLGR